MKSARVQGHSSSPHSNPHWELNIPSSVSPTPEAFTLKQPPLNVHSPSCSNRNLKTPLQKLWEFFFSITLTRSSDGVSPHTMLPFLDYFLSFLSKTLRIKSFHPLLLLIIVFWSLGHCLHSLGILGSWFTVTINTFCGFSRSVYLASVIPTIRP